MTELQNCFQRNKIETMMNVTFKKSFAKIFTIGKFRFKRLHNDWVVESKTKKRSMLLILKRANKQKQSKI